MCPVGLKWTISVSTAIIGVPGLVGLFLFPVVYGADSIIKDKIVEDLPLNLGESVEQLVGSERLDSVFTATMHLKTDAINTMVFALVIQILLSALLFYQFVKVSFAPIIPWLMLKDSGNSTRYTYKSAY